MHAPSLWLQSALFPLSLRAKVFHYHVLVYLPSVPCSVSSWHISESRAGGRTPQIAVYNSDDSRHSDY